MYQNVKQNMLQIYSIFHNMVDLTYISFSKIEV